MLLLTLLCVYHSALLGFLGRLHFLDKSIKLFVVLDDIAKPSGFIIIFVNMLLTCAGDK